jgi:MipA family protein
MLHLRRGVAALVALLACPFAALAQPAFTLPAPPFTLPFLPSPSHDWTVTLGVEGQLQPDFEGAKHDLLSPVPIFSIHGAGSPERFRSPRDSAGITLLDYEGFLAGPVFKYVPARTASKYSELNGLGDVKAAYEFGGFVEYFPTEWFRARAELRQGFGGQGGFTADLSGDVIVPLSQQWTISGGPRLTIENTPALSPYFSVDAMQALASGLPTYNAKGGFHSTGAGAQLRYQFNPQWEAHSYLEYERLLGSAASSPLVQQRGSPNQVTVGLGVSYSFDVRVR